MMEYFSPSVLTLDACFRILNTSGYSHPPPDKEENVKRSPIQPLFFGWMLKAVILSANGGTECCIMICDCLMWSWWHKGRIILNLTYNVKNKQTEAVWVCWIITYDRATCLKTSVQNRKILTLQQLMNWQTPIIKEYAFFCQTLLKEEWVTVHTTCHSSP